jgi:uncharacterized membrane protein YhhN
MRKSLNLIISVPYFLAALLVIYSRILKQPDFENVARPMLLILLMLWYGFGSSRQKTKINWYFMLGLLFSFVGDLFRTPMLDKFLVGLIFFMIGHLIYSIVFFWECKGQVIATLSRGWLFVMVIALLIISLFVGLLPSLVNSNLPFHYIAMPTLTIVLLVLILSTYVYSQVNFNNLGPLILIGGLLFLISDSFLAFHKFSIDVKLSSAWVIGFYVLAHWFIVFGYMKTKRNPQSLINP